MIKKETNYKKFKFYGENRDIQGSHLKNLAKSLQEKNLLKYNPIMVDSKMRIIDGQHRFHVAKELGIPIYYVVVPDALKNDIVLLNSNLRNWRADDYLKYYCSQKLPDYMIIQDFVDKYGFSATMALNILSLPLKSGGSLYKKFKSGTFKVSDIVLARKLANDIINLKPYTVDHSWRNREFAIAVSKFSETFPIEVLIKKLKQSGVKITTARRYVDYLRQFEHILNFAKKKEENYLRLF